MSLNLILILSTSIKCEVLPPNYAVATLHYDLRLFLSQEDSLFQHCHNTV